MKAITTIFKWDSAKDQRCRTIIPEKIQNANAKQTLTWIQNGVIGTEWN